jgi:hypothetical protein
VNELAQLAFGTPFDLAALDLDLALEELALRPHGDVLAGRHGKGAAEEACQSGEADEAGGGAGAGDPEHEGGVRDETVADAEHCGAGASAADIAVVVLGLRRVVSARARARSLLAG